METRTERTKRIIPSHVDYIDMVEEYFAKLLDLKVSISPQTGFTDDIQSDLVEAEGNPVMLYIEFNVTGTTLHEHVWKAAYACALASLRKRGKLLVENEMIVLIKPNGDKESIPAVSQTWDIVPNWRVMALGLATGFYTLCCDSIRIVPSISEVCQFERENTHAIIREAHQRFSRRS